MVVIKRKAFILFFTEDHHSSLFHFHRFTSTCLRLFVCLNVYLTCASELLAFNLADAFVSQPSGMAAAGSAGLNGVVKQVVCQPLQVTVTHKGILGQMTGKQRGGERKQDGGGDWLIIGMGEEDEHTSRLPRVSRVIATLLKQYVMMRVDVR